MNWVTRNLKQTITVWSVSSVDSYGNSSFTISTMKGRWEDGLTKLTNTKGEEVISSAVVFLASDVSNGDYLYLGSSTAATPPSGAREVIRFLKTPSIKANIFERKAILK